MHRVTPAQMGCNMSECDEADIWNLLLNIVPAKCHFQHLIPVWGKIRTFSFNLKGHAGIHPNNGAPSQAERPGKSHQQKLLCQIEPLQRGRAHVQRTDKDHWPFQGDPEKPRVVGSLSAPEHTFCKNQTLGTDACLHAFIEQKCICVPGPEPDKIQIRHERHTLCPGRENCQAKEKEKC